MSFADILLAIVLAGVMIYAARNVVKGLTTGRISIPGGRPQERARQPGAFWFGIAFEAAMVLLFGFILTRQLG